MNSIQLRGRVCIVFFAIAASLVMSNAHAQEFKAPVLTGYTLDSVRIDSSYYAKNALTVLSFFYIGCPPCMREIPVLNRLNQRFSPRGVQFVAVAPHSATQLRAWNTSETTTAFRTEPIRYLVFPECPDNGTGGTAVLCHTFSSRFGVTAYPGTVIVDRNGNLRMQIEGFPMRENPEETLKELTELIEGLLR